MNIERKITDEEAIFPRAVNYRTAFFRDSAELLITLALVVITFVMALFRFPVTGAAGFVFLAAFVIFFRGRKIIFQTSKDKFTVFHSKSKFDAFYYSEITAVSCRERRIFGLWRGFNVTISSGLKTKTYRVICPSALTFENSIFAELEKNMETWQKNRENNKIRLQNPPA